VRGGLLIYAAGESEPARHEVVNAGKRIEVVTLALSGSPDDVPRQIAAVAARIRRLRREAHARRDESITIDCTVR
jgi:hypothetical protein